MPELYCQTISKPCKRCRELKKLLIEQELLMRTLKQLLDLELEQPLEVRMPITTGSMPKLLQGGKKPKPKAKATKPKKKKVK